MKDLFRMKNFRGANAITGTIGIRVLVQNMRIDDSMRLASQHQCPFPLVTPTFLFEREGSTTKMAEPLDSCSIVLVRAHV